MESRPANLQYSLYLYLYIRFCICICSPVAGAFALSGCRGPSLPARQPWAARSLCCPRPPACCWSASSVGSCPPSRTGSGRAGSAPPASRPPRRAARPRKWSPPSSPCMQWMKETKDEDENKEKDEEMIKEEDDKKTLLVRIACWAASPP